MARVHMVSVGKAASGEQEAVPEIPETPIESSEFGEMLDPSNRLRPGVSVTIQLPADLTTQEANRLAAFIKTLPMEQDGID